MQSENTDVSSNKLRQYIIKDVLQPAYITDIKDIMKARFIWRKFANLLLIISKFTVLLGAVFAFSQTYFQVYYLSFISGIISLFGVLVAQLADFFYKESKSRTIQANSILTSLGLKDLPDIIDQSQNLNNYNNIRNQSDINNKENQPDTNNLNNIDNKSDTNKAHNVDNNPNDITIDVDDK